MDFKVAGDERGLTALQMDIKVEGITVAIIETALMHAAAARCHILQQMDLCMPKPRETLSPYAPRIRSLSIPVDKIGTIIGPGGRNIRAIEEQTGVEVQVNQDGSLRLKGPSEDAVALAVEMVLGMTATPEMGRIYRNVRVVQVAPFGAFVEILPKREGLLHVSEWDVSHTKSITDVVKEGDLVDVKVIDIQDNGRLKLSR
jgi:polyribonucleotide nucleotidyltransferase